MFGSFTPHQFVAVFGRPFGRQGADHFDRVESLAAANRERGRKGLRPVVPSWL